MPQLLLLPPQTPPRPEHFLRVPLYIRLSPTGKINGNLTKLSSLAAKAEFPHFCLQRILGDGCGAAAVAVSACTVHGQCITGAAAVSACTVHGQCITGAAAVTSYTAHGQGITGAADISSCMAQGQCITGAAAVSACTAHGQCITGAVVVTCIRRPMFSARYSAGYCA